MSAAHARRVSQEYQQHAGPWRRRQLPDEGFGECMYWTVQQDDGSYYVIMLDYLAAEYSGKLWKPRADGDGEDLLETLDDVQALGAAMLFGLYWSK